jgi:radical SAM superfamily enzyme YgiQ (UPF0313 family)
MASTAGESLRERGAILLVSCYELGHQPLAVASAAGFLERAGFLPEALDLAVERLDEAKVARARLVAISVPMHTALRLGERVARRIRALAPRAHISFYGLYALLNADYLLAGAGDSAIGGECEEPLVLLAEALERGEAGPVPGVRRRGEPAGPPYLRRLAFAPPVRRVLPPLERYARLEAEGRTAAVGYVEASRGCLHRCLHCPIPPVYGGRFFVVPEAVVLADIRRLVTAGATHITFGDPDFLNGPGHSLRLARALRREHPHVSFDFTAKVEHLVRRAALLPEFARCGCLFVVSAVESLSDRVLANLAKGHGRADFFAALAALREAGIALRPTLVAFTPWTTLEDYLEALEVFEAEGLVGHVDPVQWSIRLLVPPGSALLGSPAMRPHLLGLDPVALTWRWRHPDPRMDALHARVAAIVEDAAARGEDPFASFERIRAAALAAAGRCGGGRVPPGERRRAPRLTEPWFC